MSPQRRDAEGRRQVGPTWESLVERQIREAMDGGAFSELPFVGQRLPIEDDSAAGEWALAHRMLKNAGAAPPWIESDKEARRHLAEIDGCSNAAESRDDRVESQDATRPRPGRDCRKPRDRTRERRSADGPAASTAPRPEIERDRLERAFRGG